MELNTEINKVFGTEMAKMFASTITEEEMMKETKTIWDRMTHTEVDNWGRRQAPELEEYIRKEFHAALHQRVLDILKEPEADEVIERHARELVEKARKIADEAIVKDIAKSITARTLSVYGNHEQFVNDVLQVLNVEKERGRL